DSASSAKPVIRLGKINNTDVSSPVKRIYVETEATDQKYLAIPRNPIEDIPRSRAGHAEHDVGRSGVDESGEIILGNESDRTVIGQIHSVHSNSIRPCPSDRASGSIKHVESRIQSYRIADNCRDRGTISRSGDLSGASRQIWIAHRIRKRPVRCAVAVRS